MAARVLLQRRAAPLAASVVLGGFALAPRTVHAEAPEGSLSKKPIYDDPEPLPTSSTLPPPIPRTEQPPPAEQPSKPRSPTPTERLAVEIGKARLGLYQYAVGAEDAVNRAMDRAFNLEQSFTSTVASLAPPRESGEKLMPGAIYVLVAAMAGSIVTRNRSVLLRATAPLALGITAGWTVLPITMTNVSNLAWKYEQRFPVVAQGHLKLRESIESSWRAARVHSKIGVQYVDEKVTDARETVEDWVKKGK
ncbi:MICOS subunit MIC26 [Colletotrichum musicola]|uniref:MICOS complex subunit n=2 Tax=Colletotrichum orchidearum species complex TaxID=2707337 RepID=A0A8H6NJ03_9PEZI|nr:MICOS subunit MIC26 [Colletotrichum musicola]KAF6841164.1 MICOS subunit MIC26 [Colletotrichum plurivorum]